MRNWFDLKIMIYSITLLVLTNLVSCKNNSSSKQVVESQDNLSSKTDTTIVKDEKVETISGYFVYMADAALFTYCGSGKKVPVAMEGDYILAEKAYLNANLTNLEPLFIEIIGDIGSRDNGEGKMTPHLIIKKLIFSDSKKLCE